MSSSVSGAGYTQQTYGHIQLVADSRSRSDHETNRLAYLIFRVTAWMNDTVHIKIQIVEFLAVRIRLGCIDWHNHSFEFLRLFFDTRRHDLWKLVGQPSWNIKIRNLKQLL